MASLKALLKLPLLCLMALAGPRHWPLPQQRLLILTYHRILPVTDPRYALEQPGMVVTPDTFDKQLRWLADDGFQFVKLSDWIGGRYASATGKFCAITFDDGWQDNYEYGFPALARRAIPFHIYVVVNQIGGNGDYWPGRLARLLSNAIDQRVCLTGLAEAQWLLDLLPGGALPAHCSRAFLDAVIVAAKRHPESFLYQQLDALEPRLPEAAPAQRSLLNADELRQMLDSGLLEVGCHTANHTRLLASLNDHDFQREIVASRLALAQMLGTTVDSFCYPNGDYCEQALALVRSHYANAVTTVPGWNFPGADKHLLRRISMHEDATATPLQFWAKMSGWL